MKLNEAGVIWTNPNPCSPLQDVRITFKWDGLHGQDVRFEVTDADHKAYHTQTIASRQGEAEITVKAAGAVGVHLVRAVTIESDGSAYQRSGSFRMEAVTGIISENKNIDELLSMLEEGLRQTIDVVKINGKPVTYYKAADNSRENIAFPAFAVPALRYFIRDLKSMFDVLYTHQWPNGKLPDHIYGDTHPYHVEGTTEGCTARKRRIRRLRTIMADLETGTISMLYKAWQADGDNKWIRKLIPKIEKSLEYVRKDPRIFDPEHGLIKRAHTCDEWDVQMLDGMCFFTEKTKFVLMQGDASGFYEATRLLSDLYSDLGDLDRAKHWKNESDRLRETGNRIFWDGTKYLHHIHLDDIDHGDFDETEQLTMSNTWAITRGFADHEQAVSIVDEYFRRLEETGDRLPWWSLQPGYPDKLKYFRQGGPWSMRQGEYCNGGLFPLAGGELCRSAFQHGMEERAYGMLLDLHSIMKRDGGALFTWYDLQGNGAFNSFNNATNYDPWGLAPWTQAIVEGLAGIEPVGRLLHKVRCSPKWPAASTAHAKVTAHFPASDAYFSYAYDLSNNRLSIHFTGTGKSVDFEVLLPKGRQCTSASLDGKEAAFRTLVVEGSTYICLNTCIEGDKELVLAI